MRPFEDYMCLYCLYEEMKRAPRLRSARCGFDISQRCSFGLVIPVPKTRANGISSYSGKGTAKE